MCKRKYDYAEAVKLSVQDFIVFMEIKMRKKKKTKKLYMRVVLTAFLLIISCFEVFAADAEKIALSAGGGRTSDTKGPDPMLDLLIKVLAVDFLVMVFFIIRSMAAKKRRIGKALKGS